MPQAHPLLESDVLTCPHNGIVQLQSGAKDLLGIEGVGAIRESDLLNAQILGCMNNIAGVPSPCLCVATIPPVAVSSHLIIDGSGVIFDTQVGKILSDKGFPLLLRSQTPKAVSLDDSNSKANTQG